MRSRIIIRTPLIISLLAALLLALVSGQNAVAQEWLFHAIVDVDFVKQYVTIPAPEGVMILDSRPTKTKYDMGHIPNAVSLPDSNFDQLTHLPPKDKKNLLIFYCEGPT